MDLKDIINSVVGALKSGVGSHISEMSEEIVASFWDQVNASPKVDVLMRNTMVAENVVNAGKELGVHNWQADKSFYTLIIKAAQEADALMGKSFFSETNRMIQMAMAEPNLAGIPLSADSTTQTRSVEVSENVVIVQSLSQKRYWTDNAAPHPREWEVSGYITANGAPSDFGMTVKPSLTHQQMYLDEVAKSRRPVLFKTPRGNFFRVQITSLQFQEEASYNNAIHISCSLREYIPYEISQAIGDSMQAVKIT